MADDALPNDGEQGTPLLDAPEADVGKRPKWILVVSAVFAGITLVFFMLLVLVAVLGYDVPADARFLVIVVLALGAAISAGFLGGAAAIRGTLGIESIQKNPFAYSVAGGIAVLVLVLQIGYFLYVKPATRVNYAIVPVPSHVPAAFQLDNISTERIADLGEVRTKGKKRFFYVEFRNGEDSGEIRLSYPKLPGSGFETLDFTVELDGTLTTK